MAIVKLRIAGIVTFVLYMLSGLFESQLSPNYYFIQARQILILVSLIIFIILILVQCYGFYINNFAKGEEEDV